MKPMPERRWLPLYRGKERWQWARASSMQPKRARQSGRYFRVLHWASESGLSPETWGRPGFGDREVHQQFGEGPGADAGVAIGVQGQRSRLDPLSGDGLGNQLLCE